MNLGERLKKLREDRNLTLEDVGNYVGVNKATVQRYESGNIDIKRNIAIKLSEILQTTPSCIMGWSENHDHSLSQTEKLIIDNTRDLNDEGQIKVANYIDDLATSGKYTKSSPRPSTDNAKDKIKIYRAARSRSGHEHEIIPDGQEIIEKLRKAKDDKVLHKEDF